MLHCCYAFHRAEGLAAQIKDLQGEMADYNTLMDKLNTDTEIGAILMDFDMVGLRIKSLGYLLFVSWLGF